MVTTDQGDQPNERSARDESNPALVAALRAELATAGRMTFARFMEVALYDPDEGYYRGAQERPGRGGDFLTAPELSSFFGHCLARQARQIWDHLGQPAQFTILEYGAGGGRLAQDLLAAARDEAPDFARAIRYRLHELNPHRRAAAQARLEHAGFAGQLIFETPGTATAETADLTGMILTNEFVDALPVHRVIGQEDDALLERYVRWDDERAWFAEELGPPSTPRLVAALAAGGVRLAAGQQAEINLAAADWLATAVGRLARGAILTIDYGYPTAELYAPKRREGTFLCYARHQATDDPYRQIGAQDMTAHVDFGALIRAGERLGLATLGLTTQGPFLSNLGLGDLLVAAQTPGRALSDYLTDRSAVLALIAPGGMGRFAVLAQGKDFPATPQLCGFGPLR